MNEGRRSREGAWIEIDAAGLLTLNDIRRSREGAWIEIPLNERSV